MKKIRITESDLNRIVYKVLKEQDQNSKSERIKSIVNKFGIKQAIDMIAGGIDTIRQVYQDNLSLFMDQFNNLTPVKKGTYIFYVDENRLPLFFYSTDDKNDLVYINNERIWVFFEKIIGLNRPEIQEIMNIWLEDTYNITGLTPHRMNPEHIQMAWNMPIV